MSYANGTFESEATYSCDLGFVLFGDIRVTCTSCSVWNAPPPVCVPIGKLHIHTMVTFEPRHAIFNYVAFLQVLSQTSLCSLLLRFETPH